MHSYLQHGILWFNRLASLSRRAKYSKMGPYKRYLYTGEKISRSTLYRRRQRAEQKALKEKLAYPKPTMETLPPYENTENVHHIEIKPQFETEISDKPVGDIQMLMNLFTANIQSLQKNIEEKLDKVAAAISTQVSKLDKRISNLEDMIDLILIK